MARICRWTGWFLGRSVWCALPRMALGLAIWSGLYLVVIHGYLERIWPHWWVALGGIVYLVWMPSMLKRAIIGVGPVYYAQMEQPYTIRRIIIEERTYHDGRMDVYEQSSDVCSTGDSRYPIYQGTPRVG